LRFNLSEASGSLGDLGTFLPIAAALAAVNRMDLGTIFLFAGAMNIATGLLFRLPVPVQPMKAIAAIAIAESLTPGAIAASGMAMGVIVTTLALVGAVRWIDAVAPRAVVRGVQAGVGAKLALTGMAWTAGLPAVGVDSAAAAVVLAALVALVAGRRLPVALLLFLLGLSLAAWRARDEFGSMPWSPPTLGPIAPTAQDWITGLTRGVIPQLPLTLLNSVIAVCALSSDLFPGRGVAPRRMALSVGLMNLLCAPFGGMPMCHGAGGLAAQHRFGARTGGSVVMLGAGKIIFALALGGSLMTLAQGFPRAILAVLVFFAGLTLMKPARESLRSAQPAVVMLLTAATIVLAGALVGVLVGSAAAGALARLKAERANAA